jgi:RHS repeat-associated protein
MLRLSSIQVGSGGSILNRGYTYDNVGNVATITGSPTIGTQTFTYDQRDRLTNWTATGINENYAYDLVGNITSKAGTTYNYNGYINPSGSGGPYAIRNTGYTYDANGNMTAMPTNSRTLVWNTENQPTSITSSGTTETYTYDADGARIKKLRGTTNTHYIGGLAEEDKPTGIGSTVTRSMYTFDGQVVAQRSVASGGISYNTLVYLHSDHLGSVGASSSSTGASLSSQEYDPWGKVRTGGVTQTKYNYTGQKLDDTGLLFYNARYYDPQVGRFTSSDSIIPTLATTRLVVDFHEITALILVNQENFRIVQSGFWSQDYSGERWGVGNPQVLNRFSYVVNNPLNQTDPSGHTHCPNYDICGGVVHNNSSHSVWVFGTIYDPDYKVTPRREYPYMQERMDIDGNPDRADAKRPLECGASGYSEGRSTQRSGKPCAYVQGWFVLPAHTSSDTFTGWGHQMEDVDAVRGYNEPLYDARGLGIPFSYPHERHDSTTEEYKFSNASSVTIVDFFDVAVLWTDEAKGIDWYAQWLLVGLQYPGKYGWKTCHPNCIYNPLLGQ